MLPIFLLTKRYLWSINMAITHIGGENVKGLRDCRNKMDLTQTELATLLGVHQSTVADWETGKKYPTGDKLPLIAKALNCTIDELYAKQSA